MIVSAMAIGNAGSTLYLPALITITNKLHTSSALVKISLSCYLSTFALSQLIYGPLSDAYGRKKILISGLIIFLIGSIIAIFATNIYSFLMGRLIEGLGIGAANAVGYALLRDIYVGNELFKKISYVSVFVGLIPIIAPLIGGYLVQYINWQACFILLSLLAISIILIQYFKLPETNQGIINQAINLKTVVMNYCKIITNRTYLVAILTAGIGFSSLLSLNAMLPFIIIKHLHISPADYGWLTLVVGGGYFIGAFIGGILATKFDVEFAIKCGIFIQIVTAIISLIIAFYYFNLLSVLIPLTIILVGVGITVPTSAGMAMALFPELAGAAAALLGATMFGVSAIFTSTVTHLSSSSLKPLLIFLLTLSFIALWIFFGIKSRKANP